jgi:hypothetical protein
MVPTATMGDPDRCGCDGPGSYDGSQAFFVRFFSEKSQGCGVSRWWIEPAVLRLGVVGDVGSRRLRHLAGTGEQKLGNKIHCDDH